MRKRILRKRNIILGNNYGTTLVEMIVCFALLGIFLVAAATFIITLTGFFFHVTGETYSRQVSDIILEKVASEIDGAEYDAGVSNPMFKTETVAGETVECLDLYDKTDTHVSISFDKAKEAIKIHYYPIEYSEDIYEDERREATDWYFDESVYNGFKIKDMRIVRANKLSEVVESEDFRLSDFGLSKAEDSLYPNNVVVVLVHLRHPKYKDYYTYRYVRMYHVPEDYDWGEESASG